MPPGHGLGITVLDMNDVIVADDFRIGRASAEMDVGMVSDNRVVRRDDIYPVVMRTVVDRKARCRTGRECLACARVLQIDGLDARDVRSHRHGTAAGNVQQVASRTAMDGRTYGRGRHMEGAVAAAANDCLRGTAEEHIIIARAEIDGVAVICSIDRDVRIFCAYGG